MHLKDAKGKKDRITIFPEKIKKDLNKLIICKENNNYVFESERSGKLISRSAQKIFENTLKKSSIKKDATFHFILYGIVSPYIY